MQRHYFPGQRFLFSLLAVVSVAASGLAQTRVFFEDFEGGASFADRTPGVEHDWTQTDAYDPDNPNPTVAWDLAGPVSKDKNGNIYFGSGNRGNIPHSGTNSVYCARRGFEGTLRAPIYPNDQILWLSHANIDLTGFTSATLSFWHKVKIPDAFSVSISAIDSDILNVYIDDEPLSIWTSTDIDQTLNDWTKVIIPLDSYIDPSLEENIHSITFEFVSDGDNPIFNKNNNPDEWIDDDEDFGVAVKETDYEGVYVDDVLVSGVKAPFWPDYDQDGTTDLIFQAPGGALTDWHINQSDFLGSASIRNGTGPGAAWKLAAYANLDTNDESQCVDMIFQHTNGSLQAWYFNYDSYVVTNRVTVTTNIPTATLTRSAVTNITKKTNFFSSGAITRTTNTVTTKLVKTTNTLFTTNLTVITNLFSPGSLTRKTNKFVFQATNRIVNTKITVATNIVTRTKLPNNQFTTKATNLPPSVTITETNHFFFTTKAQPFSFTNVTSIPPYPKYMKTVGLKKPNAGWQLAATADLNNDGQRDFIFQSPGGGVAYWLMNGTNFIKAGNILGTNNAPKTLGPGYKVVGAGDFTGDGQTDLLLQLLTRGDLQVWTLSESNGIVKNVGVAGFTPLKASPYSPSLHFVGSFDFEGDTMPDFIMQHTDGRVFIWYVDINRKVTTVAPVRNGISPGSTMKLIGPH